MRNANGELYVRKRKSALPAVRLPGRLNARVAKAVSGPDGLSAFAVGFNALPICASLEGA